MAARDRYGTTKAISELLINDYSRKGFIDGRGARLPTVIVRPGKPNGASTSCYSGVIREPLDGVDVSWPSPVMRSPPDASALPLSLSPLFFSFRFALRVVDEYTPSRRPDRWQLAQDRCMKNLRP